MGRRVLTVTEMTFHQKRVRNGETRSPSDLDGKDLLNIFHDWVNDIPEEDQNFGKYQTFVVVKSAKRVAARVLLVDLRVGSFGEPGEVRDVNTKEIIHTITDNEAPMGSNRALLFVPQIGERAYFLAEESSRGSGGSRILAMFKHHFSESIDTITMTTARETEAETWTKLANLAEIEVRITGRSVDIADGPEIKVGRLSHLARPVRGSKYFPRHLLKKLSDEKVLRKVVSVPDLDPDHEVYVTMEYGDRSKKFLLGNETGPAIREVLSEAGERPLTDEVLIDRCAERISDLLQRHQESWDFAWSKPKEG